MLAYFLFPNTIDSSKSKKVSYYLILLYIFSLFIKSAPVISNILMAILVLNSIYAFKWQKNRIKTYINLSFCFFFILQALTLLYSDDLKEGWRIMQLRLPLFALALAFCFIDFPKQLYVKVLLFFALITTLGSFLGFFNGMVLANQYSDSGFLYNDNISAFILDKQAVYFAFYVNVAIFSIVYVLSLKEKELESKRILLISALAWLFFINFMLASKMAMISLYLFSAVYIFNYLIKNKKVFEMFLLLFTLAIGAFLIYKWSPKTLNRFTGIFDTEFKFDNNHNENHFNASYDVTKWNSTNTRIAIWKCSKELVEENILLGVGIGDKKTALINKYKKNNFIYAERTEKNTHNQYLDILISMGLIGLIIFLVIYFFIPCVYFIKVKAYFSLALFICAMMCLFTENMFDRYQGEIILAFMLPLGVNLAFQKTNYID